MQTLIMQRFPMGHLIIVGTMCESSAWGHQLMLSSEKFAIIF
jgi:hypothetical protein